MALIVASVPNGGMELHGGSDGNVGYAMDGTFCLFRVPFGCKLDSTDFLIN